MTPEFVPRADSQVLSLLPSIPHAEQFPHSGSSNHSGKLEMVIAEARCTAIPLEQDEQTATTEDADSEITEVKAMLTSLCSSVRTAKTDMVTKDGITDLEQKVDQCDKGVRSVGALAKQLNDRVCALEQTKRKA